MFVYFLANFTIFTSAIFQLIFTSRNRNEPTLVDCTSPADNPEWSQILCSDNHTAALTKKGEVFTWGGNYCGELGHGDMASRDTSTKIASLDGVVITQISCGYNHMAALTQYGEVFTW